MAKSGVSDDTAKLGVSGDGAEVWRSRRLAERCGRCHACYVLPVPTNVLGGELRCCCRNPLTGFYRDGYCRTGSGDSGLHTVCAQMTNEFLEFSYARGNDLVTPQDGFPGLKEGDRWCLCVTRWHEALEAGAAPPVDLHATHASTLEFVTLEELQAHAVT
jgi:uncharacterized protein (DUF2237 family)